MPISPSSGLLGGSYPALFHVSMAMTQVPIDWRYLPYIRPKFQGISWNSHWMYENDPFTWILCRFTYEKYMEKWSFVCHFAKCSNGFLKCYLVPCYSYPVKYVLLGLLVSRWLWLIVIPYHRGIYMAQMGTPNHDCFNSHEWVSSILRTVQMNMDIDRYWWISMNIDGWLMDYGANSDIW